MSQRYVYLIRWGERHKIGRSMRPGVRLTEVVPSCCRAEAEVVHYFPSARDLDVERALHRRFADSALGGEWFTLDPEDVEAFRTVSRADRPSDLPESLRPPGEEPPRPGAGRTVSVVFPEDVLGRLEGLARSLSRTVAEEVRHAVRRHLDRPPYLEGAAPPRQPKQRPDESEVGSGWHLFVCGPDVPVKEECLSDSMREQLDALSAGSGRMRAHLINEAVRRYLSERRADVQAATSAERSGEWVDRTPVDD